MKAVAVRGIAILALLVAAALPGRAQTTPEQWCWGYQASTSQMFRLIDGADVTGPSGAGKPDGIIDELLQVAVYGRFRVDGTVTKTTYTASSTVPSVTATGPCTWGSPSGKFDCTFTAILKRDFVTVKSGWVGWSYYSLKIVKTATGGTLLDVHDVQLPALSWSLKSK